MGEGLNMITQSQPEPVVTCRYTHSHPPDCRCLIIKGINENKVIKFLVSENGALRQAHNDSLTESRCECGGTYGHSGPCAMKIIEVCGEPNCPVCWINAWCDNARQVYRRQVERLLAKLAQ